MNDFEHRLRRVEQDFAAFKAKVEPVLTLGESLHRLSIQVIELQGSLRVLKGQAVVVCATASIVAELLLKLLHL
jgi:hypothetical protein